MPRRTAIRSRRTRSAPTSRASSGTSNITYQVRDDNLWTLASNFGDSSTQTCPIPTRTSLNALDELAGAAVGMDARIRPGLLRQRPYGSATRGRNYVHDRRSRVCIVTYQIDPQLQIAPRIGYENNEFPLTSYPRRRSTASAGSGVRRTGRRWRDFGSIASSASSYSAQISHRLPQCRAERELRARTHQLSAERAGHSGGRQRRASSSMRRSRRGFPDPAERALAVAAVPGADGIAADAGEPGELLCAKHHSCRQSAHGCPSCSIGVRNSLAFYALLSRRAKPSPGREPCFRRHFSSARTTRRRAAASRSATAFPG